MGLSLDSTKSKKVKTKAKAPPSKKRSSKAEELDRELFGEEEETKLAKSSRSRKTKPTAPKTKKAPKHYEDLDDGDEVVSTVEEEAWPPESELVSNRPEYVTAFSGGFVNIALQNAVNAHWRKSPESELFLQLVKTELLASGVFIGSIRVKSSFIVRTGGMALL